MAITDPGTSDSEEQGLERVSPPATPKRDRRRTGGLANRSPAQIAAYERMREAAAAKLDAQRRAKVEEGLKLLAAEEAAAPPPRRSSKRSVSKSTRGPVILFGDESEDSDSSHEPPQIVIKTSRAPRKPRAAVIEPKLEPEPERQAKPEPARHQFSFVYV